VHLQGCRVLQKKGTTYKYKEILKKHINGQTKGTLAKTRVMFFMISRQKTTQNNNFSQAFGANI